MKRIATPLLLLAVAFVTLGDEKKAAEPEAENASQKKQETPPPTTLDEAHQQLEKLFPKDELAKIDAMRSEDEMNEYHFGIGMGMRNSWGLWSGGPLATYMNKLGFHNADDMSGVILATFWCKRHNKEFRLKERAADDEAFAKANAAPPPSANDPKDGSPIEWRMSFGANGDNKFRRIHVGKSKKTGRLLVYEYDKGVYEPDLALLKHISELDDTGIFSPHAIQSR